MRAGETTGKKSAQLPDEAAVARLSGLMSLPHRVLRLPLRGAERVVADDARYQDVILPSGRGC